MFVCLKYCLLIIKMATPERIARVHYARTFEKSEEGHMTKLSLELDQDIKRWILRSSNMLSLSLARVVTTGRTAVLIKFVYKSSLHDFGLLRRSSGGGT